MTFGPLSFFQQAAFKKQTTEMHLRPRPFVLILLLGAGLARAAAPTPAPADASYAYSSPAFKALTQESYALRGLKTPDFGGWLEDKYAAAKLAPEWRQNSDGRSGGPQSRHRGGQRRPTRPARPGHRPVGAQFHQKNPAEFQPGARLRVHCCRDCRAAPVPAAKSLDRRAPPASGPGRGRGDGLAKRPGAGKQPRACGGPAAAALRPRRRARRCPATPNRS